MHRRLDFNDAAVLLGVVLLLFGIAGLYIDSSTTLTLRRLPDRPEDSPARGMLRRVYEPFLETQPPATTAPTLTPFQIASPTTPVEMVISTPEVPAGDNTFLVPGTPPPTAVPLPVALVPERIAIPAIGLDAPVLQSGYKLVLVNGQTFQQWEAPLQYAAGWQQTSALLGVPGNTVLNGHHNIHGAVFARLIDLVEGDAIQLYSGEWVISYEVNNKILLPERGEDLSVRLNNARWMQSTDDERLTLVTCWPPDSNTHRLFIVAVPVDKQLVSSGQNP